MPNLYVIAGCNGAGKTTASFTLLPEILECNEFVNADEIAKGISPFNVDAVALEAGRIMLKRINELLEEKKSFAFETTLSTKSYVSKIKAAQKNGYKVTLVFFWLRNDDLAVERVKVRVKEGGHNIPEKVVRRRYFAGLNNLFKLYLPLCDNWIVFDNSTPDSSLIAEGRGTEEENIIELDSWNKMKELANG
ncbi:MAG: zeta toxin family protein [Crocinitomicaceae bacterium]|nr:zeta toxin family protein [Crocinitomicaceae bacterium]